MALPADAPPRIDPTAVVDEGASLGPGTRVWHFAHVMGGAVVGRGCVIGQGCFVAASAVLGDGVKLQNNVSVYDGVELADDVFCGPSSVFTNVVNPRAAVSRKHEYRWTRVGKGATVGANATIVAGVTIGEHAFVGAGATVTRDVAPFSLVTGVPARPHGWMSRHGERLRFDEKGRARCPATGEEYVLVGGQVRLADVTAPGSATAATRPATSRAPEVPE